MSRILNWSEDELSSYYFEREIDLSWLTKPSRHQFRWKSLKGPWITSDRRISSSKKLIELFSNSIPSDVYVSTSSWLNPVNLPRIKDTKKPSPILLDHLVVFDIDIRPFSLVRLEEARKATVNLRNWLIDNTNIDNAIFGTGKFYKEKQEHEKENIYENIDEMLTGTLNKDED